MVANREYSEYSFFEHERILGRELNTHTTIGKRGKEREKMLINIQAKIWNLNFQLSSSSLFVRLPSNWIEKTLIHTLKYIFWLYGNISVNGTNRQNEADRENEINTELP